MQDGCAYTNSFDRPASEEGLHLSALTRLPSGSGLGHLWLFPHLDILLSSFRRLWRYMEYKGKKLVSTAYTHGSNGNQDIHTVRTFSAVMDLVSSSEHQVLGWCFPGARCSSPAVQLLYPVSKGQQYLFTVHCWPYQSQESFFRNVIMKWGISWSFK